MAGSAVGAEQDHNDPAWYDDFDDLFDWMVDLYAGVYDDYLHPLVRWARSRRRAGVS